MNLDADIADLGGLAATHELYARRWTKYQLGAAVRDGTVIRVRQGWYASPTTSESLQQSARIGGHLTCTTAAAALGLWVRPLPGLHIAVSPNAARLRTRVDKNRRLSLHPDATITVHWTEQHDPATRYVAGVRQILRDMAWCQSPELVVGAVDSALRAGWLSPAQWREEVHLLPKRLRKLLLRVDARSESLLESIMRFRLSMLGLAARPQVRIAGAGRVDLMLGTRLVIELDGWEFHSSREQFEEDRRRDAKLAELGYRVLRFTYRQLTRGWARVKAAVLACIERGDHI